MVHFRAVLIAAATATVAGCSHLPVDGPAHRDITGAASVHLAADKRALAFDYVLLDIGPNVLDALHHVGSESLHRSFDARGGDEAPAARLGPGDVVQITVFESAVGGLFLPAESGPRPANFVTIPAQSVTRAGTVSIPYAGVVRVAGRTVPEVERDIERRLAKRAIEPQVVMTVVEQNAQTVSVVGDGLSGSNKFKLSMAGEKVLDMIARAGGIKHPGHEIFVTLQRNGRRATIHFPRLILDANENIYVAPEDVLYVYRDTPKFTAFGALGSAGQTSGLTGLFAFEQEQLALNEALAKAGGLQDGRANPSQVFLYRVEYRDVLEKTGVNLSAFEPDQKLIPTVYRANFRDPSFYFAAQRFKLRNKDVLYVANADANEIGKFLGFVRTVTGTVGGVATDYTAVRGVFNSGGGAIRVN